MGSRSLPRTRRASAIAAALVLGLGLLSTVLIPQLQTSGRMRSTTGPGDVRLLAWDTSQVHPSGPVTPREVRTQRRLREAARDRRERISRAGTPRIEPGRTSRLPAWASACSDDDAARDHANGLVPDPELCDLPLAGHRLHADAAHAWARLNRAYQARFDKPLCLTDSYRSLTSQQSLYASKPGLAATPGTSNHGWGVAVDLCDGVEFGASPEYVWLAENGARLGWVNPAWARPGGSRPEPWHWEFQSESS